MPKTNLVSVMKKKLSEAWSLDARSLSVFRVGIALIVIVDICFKSRFLVDYYTDFGPFSRDIFLENDNSSMLSFHLMSGQIWFQILLFIVHGFFALWLLVGYRTWVAAILVFVFTVSLHNRGMIINSSTDDLLLVMLFWAMFLPLDRHWSWESDRHKAGLHPHLKRIISIGTVAFIAQQLIIYWMHAFSTLNSAGTWNYLILIGILAPILWIVPLFHVWFRYIGMLLIIFLHVGVSDFSSGLFGWISTVSILALIPAHFWDGWIKRQAPRGEIKIYFDDHCELCRRWTRLLRSYCFLWGVDYIGLSSAPASIQKLSEEEDSWVVSNGRKTFTRYSAFVELIQQSWLFRPFHYFGNIFPLNIIGNQVYKFGNHLRNYCRIAYPVIPYASYSGAQKIAAVICFISLYAITVANISQLPYNLDGLSSPQRIIQGHNTLIRWWNAIPRLDQDWKELSSEPKNKRVIE